MGTTPFGAMQFYTRKSTAEHGHLKNELKQWGQMASKAYTFKVVAHSRSVFKRYRSKSIPLWKKWIGFYFRKPTVALYILLSVSPSYLCSMCGGPVVSCNPPLRATCSFKATLAFFIPQHMCACAVPSASQTKRPGRNTSRDGMSGDYTVISLELCLWG